MRKEKADSTRAVLFALSRHKFLFCLPNSVERRAEAGEYDIVVNDYARAKNLFGKTEIPVSCDKYFTFIRITIFIMWSFSDVSTCT